MKSRYPYLTETKPGMFYVRVKGRYTRVRGAMGTEEFDRSYWEARNGKRAAAKTSWKALIASYRKSTRWTKLKPRTQKDYERVILYLIDLIGDTDVRNLKRQHVIQIQHKNLNRIKFANDIPRIMSVLCEHAIDLGWRADNPAKGARSLPMPKGNKRPHLPWPDWAVEQWRAEASPIHRLIFEIGVGSVQRPGDWIKFRWSNYDGEALSITQGKTDVKLWLPCTNHLKAALNGVDKKGLTILTQPNGQPMTYDYMSKLMLAERKRLDLAAYDLHALRYRGVMELAWAGCTDDEIASYSGHTTKQMIAKYAGEARQRMRAQQAKDKRR